MRNFVTLGFGEVAGRFFSVVGTVYLARVLGVRAYGVLGFVVVVITYCSVIVDWGFTSYGPHEVSRNRLHMASLLPSILIARLTVAGVLIVGITVIGISQLPEVEATVLGIYSLVLAAMAINTRWVHLGLERTGLIVLAVTISEFTKTLLFFVLVHSPDHLTRVPLVQFSGEIVAAALLMAWLRRRGIGLSMRFDLAVVRRSYGDSFALMLVALLALVIYNADVVYIRAWRDSTEVGIYVAAYTIINILGVLGYNGHLSLLPTLTRLADTEDGQTELYQTAMARIFALGLPIAVGGCLVAPMIIRLLYGPSYEQSGIVLQILIWSIPFFLLRLVLQSVLISVGRQTRVLQMTAWATACNLGLNLIFVPRFGMFGAAWIMVLTEVVRMTLAHIYVHKAGFPLIGLARYWRTIAAAMAMGTILSLVRTSSLWAALALGVVVYSLALTLVGGIQFRRRQLPVLRV